MIDCNAGIAVRSSDVFRNEIGQPSNADVMAKLGRMMGAMVLKEYVQIAQIEVINQMRSEISSQSRDDNRKR